MLTVGAVWQAAYELYAHSAVARQAGLSGDAIRALAGGLPADIVLLVGIYHTVCAMLNAFEIPAPGKSKDGSGMG
jgi:4-carboxymuconolactone decarboxylase